MQARGRWLLAVGLTIGALAGYGAPALAGEVDLVGPLTRAAIEAACPDWVEQELTVAPDPEAAARLATVGAGARVTVYLGTWCSDSRRELARLWRRLDEVGDQVPFEISYIGVAHARDARPPELASPLGVVFLPTFVVDLDGRELGRIVESSPGGIEVDLSTLLSGEASGLISGREDLTTGAGDGGHG